MEVKGMDISQLYQLLGLYSGSGSSYGLYGNSYGNYGQESFGQVLKNTAAVRTSGGISTPMDEIFEAASKETGVDIRLLKAVGKAESNFRASATSHCGAMGVMQLMPATAKSLGVTNAYDARQNIMAGSRYLAKLLDKYDGDTSLALAAYNAGSGNVAKYGGIPPFKETQNYVKRVLEYAGEDFNANQSVNISVDEEGVQGGNTVALSYDSGYEDMCRMFVQMMQLQMQQKLQSILDFDGDESSNTFI